MNKVQRTILAIIAPILLLGGAYTMADSTFDVEGSDRYCRQGDWDCLSKKISKNRSAADVGAGDLEKTWVIWLTAISSIGVIEFLLFREKSKSNE